MEIITTPSSSGPSTEGTLTASHVATVTILQIANPAANTTAPVTDKGVSTGGIAGIVIGSLAVLVLAAFLIYIVRRQKAPSPESDSMLLGDTVNSHASELAGRGIMAPPKYRDEAQELM